MTVSPAGRLDPETHAALLSTFDIGPTRTLQQDVEYGVLQIVDIALKAISPAVNDPSTAITCLDQLSRILIRWIARDSPDTLLFSPPHVLRVVVPWIDFDGILETAFEQIRHYAEGDVAVSLRLLRMLQDVAETSQDFYIRSRLMACGERVFEGCGTRFDAPALARVGVRLAAMRGGWVARKEDGALPSTRWGLRPQTPLLLGVGGFGIVPWGCQPHCWFL